MCRSKTSASDEPDYKALITFLKAMGFKTLMQRVAEKAGVDASQVETGQPHHRRRCHPSRPVAPVDRDSFPLLPPPTPGEARTGPGLRTLTPISLSERRLEALRASKIDPGSTKRSKRLTV